MVESDQLDSGSASDAARAVDGRSGPIRRLRPRTKVLPEHARGHNRSLVLQTLYHGGAMSRADLARETGLTRVTISDLVGEFVAEGIVVEIGVREVTGPGKPPILVDIDRDGHHILGIDLSGPAVFDGAVMTLDGDVVARRTVPRVDQDSAAAYEATVSLARELAAASNRPILGVGIGAPGIVRADGVVISSPNLGWHDMPLEQRLGRDLDLPVIVRNDANAAVLAEYTFGEERNDFVLVRIGRGVGAGLITDGQLLWGSRSAAGEIGHVVVGTDGGPRCACGKDGCLEAWLTIPRLRAAVEADPEAAQDVLRDAGERLAIAFAPIVAALDLTDIVLSGPTDLLNGVFIEAATDTLRSRTMEGVYDDVSIHVTSQDDIMLRGTAVMVLAEQLGVS